MVAIHNIVQVHYHTIPNIVVAISVVFYHVYEHVRHDEFVVVLVLLVVLLLLLLLLKMIQ